MANQSIYNAFQRFWSNVKTLVGKVETRVANLESKSLTKWVIEETNTNLNIYLKDS